MIGTVYVLAGPCKKAGPSGLQSAEDRPWFVGFEKDDKVVLFSEWAADWGDKTTEERSKKIRHYLHGGPPA